MKTKAVLFFVGLLAIALNVIAQEKYSRVKILLDAGNATAQKKFIYGNLHVDHASFEDNAFVVEIGPREMDKLRQSGYRYEVITDDVAADFVRRNDVSRFFESEQQARMGFINSCQQVSAIIQAPPAFGPGSMGGYYTLEEMRQAMGYLVQNYPGIVDTFSIGRSVENRDIWCIKISDQPNSDENEPEALLVGLQHAREAITGTSLIFFMQYLCQNYGSNPRITDLVNNREIFIIPCANPDGYERNRRTDPGGGGMQRKNRRKNTGSDSTGAGVDLNRNYAEDWGNCPGSLSDPNNSCGTNIASEDTYIGTGPFSEPETRAIRDFTYQRNFKIALDQHSNGAYYSLPFGRPTLHTMDPVDALVYTYTPALMGLYNCHRAGNSPQSVGYEVAGGFKDWMLLGDIESTPGEANAKEKVYGITGEANGGSFWPSAASILPLCKELCFQDLQIVLTAGSYADIQDANDIILPPEGSANFTVRRVGLTDAPITVTLIPIENIITASPSVTINSIPTYHNAVTASIPYSVTNLGNGQRIRFIWRMQTGGITIDDTITKFHSPFNVLYDNMEAGAATDRWDITGAWGYTTNGGYGGTGRTLSESPGGFYTHGITGTNSTAEWNAPIDLSNATAAYLSFWVRHRSENCRDNMRIQFSVNGGPFVNSCGRNTVSENFSALGGQPALTGIRENWTRELVDMSSYIGAANNNVRFRFLFNSNANVASDDYYRQVDEGFFIDNVRIIKSVDDLVVLPVRFLRFEGRMIGEGRAELSWDAETDNNHNYFELERSSDNRGFISLGRSPSVPPYKMTDPSLQPGNNYYRVKQVDRDGRIVYSNVINIIYNPGRINLMVFPNPVTDQLKIRMASPVPGKFEVLITDVAGKIISKQSILVGTTAVDVPIDFKAQAAQVYLLTIRNSDNEVITVQKIIKQ
jgi:carboxypeptidase T